MATYPELECQNLKPMLFIYVFYGPPFQHKIHQNTASMAIRMCTCPCRLLSPTMTACLIAARVKARGRQDCFQAAAKILALLRMASGVELDQFTTLFFSSPRTGRRQDPQQRPRTSCSSCCVCIARDQSCRRDAVVECVIKIDCSLRAPPVHAWVAGRPARQDFGHRETDTPALVFLSTTSVTEKTAGERPVFLLLKTGGCAWRN